MNKNICFTGHRKIAADKALESFLYKFLEILAEYSYAENFYAGGAVGFDMLCEETVLKLRNKHPSIKLHLVLPCPEKEQTEKFTAAEKERYYNILTQADSVEICSEHFSKNCMKIRNLRLVECADMCICYFSGKRGGTFQTVRMAKEKGIDIFNIY